MQRERRLLDVTVGQDPYSRAAHALIGVCERVHDGTGVQHARLWVELAERLHRREAHPRIGCGVGGCGVVVEPALHPCDDGDRQAGGWWLAGGRRPSFAGGIETHRDADVYVY